MALDNESTPRIIKKVKKSSGHHGGAWKVAYADFVTAMMALFIVLWVLSQSQQVKKLVANYFRNPLGFSNQGKNILNSDHSSIQNLEPDNSMSMRLKEKEILKNMGNKIMVELADDPSFKNLMGQIKIAFVKEGLKIEIEDSAKNIFFQVGTAELTAEAERLLKKIGNELAKLPNKIIIEGHTDARPYSGGSDGYTNFDLSADRANSARRALTEGSLSIKQIEDIRGYADRKLRDPEHPYSFVNRRISIIIKYLGRSK